MSDENRWIKEQPFSLVIAILLPLFYVGAYLAIMQQGAPVLDTPPGTRMKLGKPFPLYY